MLTLEEILERCTDTREAVVQCKELAGIGETTEYREWVNLAVSNNTINYDTLSYPTWAAAEAQAVRLRVLYNVAATQQLNYAAEMTQMMNQSLNTANWLYS